MKKRAYPVPGIDVMQPAQLVQSDLARDHEVRLMPIVGQPGVMMEVRRIGSVLQGAGIHRAVMRIWIQPNPQGFVVTVGTDGNLENQTKGAVEWLLTTPAALTEGYAAFKQNQVDERVFRTVEYWVATIARVRGPAPVPNGAPCPQCKAAMPMGARFCPKCAFDTSAKLPPAAPAATKFCVQCGHTLEADAKFCSSCGRAQE